jgi:hypothetical protein
MQQHSHAKGQSDVPMEVFMHTCSHAWALLVITCTAGS